jgi:hypothetical protein
MTGYWNRSKTKPWIGASDLPTVLRKCKVLAAKLKNHDFEDWVHHELYGYPKDAVPEYRILWGLPQGNFLGGGGSGLLNVSLQEHDIDPGVIDRFVRIKLEAGAVALQLMLDRARAQDGCYKVAWPAAAMAFYKSSNVSDRLVLAQAWTLISENMLVGILDRIRNMILDFVLQIMEANPDAGEAPIGSPAVSVEKSTQIYQNTITVHGNVGSLAGGSVGTQINVEMVKPGELESLKAFLLSAGLPAPEVVELETAIRREPKARSFEAVREASGWWTKIKKRNSFRHNCTCQHCKSGAGETGDRSVLPALRLT